MRKSLLFIFLLASLSMQAQLRIISYNVENLFDTKHDSLKLDEDFTPDGRYHWTKSRYNRKLENLSRVIVSIGEWKNAAVVGLCEVENEQCIIDLLNIGKLKHLGYEYIHQDSPDERGIDCALLYDPKQLTPVSHAFIRVPMPESERPTRDIIYMCAQVKQKGKHQHSHLDTLHIMMCHLPSQLGGAEQTAHKRAIAHRILQHTVDSILFSSYNAKIIIMGDMNSAPTDHLRGMRNLMVPIEKELRSEAGTHKWQGYWSCLDQFYVSKSLLEKARAHIYNESWILERDEKYGGEQPMRCYKYTTWQPGYSDHLPIYLDITH